MAGRITSPTSCNHNFFKNKSSTSPKPLPHTHSPYLSTRSGPFSFLPSGFTSKLRTYGEDAGIVRNDIAGEESTEGYGVGPALEAVMRWLLAHGSSGSTEVKSKSHSDRSKEEIEAQREGGSQGSIEGVPCVSTLHIFRVMDDEMPALRAYLCACKDTLEDLMMFLYQGHTKRDDFDLSSHTALRSVYLASNGSKPMRVLHDILSTLQALPTSQMRKIYLQIPQWQLASDDDAWGTLDGLLKGLLESSGKELKISAIVDERHKYDNSNENEEDVTFGLRCKLRERLPLLTSFMSPIGSARSLDKARNEKQDNSRFTILSNSTREMAQYVDEVFGRMRTF
ncbi:hypothetical protein LENED_003750 [Lentinula edodes]|uniref:Uncharacterized protein n=1 Tax=Lentinula edodes TaxID=5353 RepID=A0A1Q3E4F5_LENED|nr:hypothetical protein LENED_003750 [Lentinula edodes]